MKTSQPSYRQRSYLLRFSTVDDFGVPKQRITLIPVPDGKAHMFAELQELIAFLASEEGVQTITLPEEIISETKL